MGILSLGFFYTIIQGWIYVIIHLPKPMECIRPRLYPNVNNRLKLTVMTPFWHAYCKSTTSMPVLIKGDIGC